MASIKAENSAKAVTPAPYTQDRVMGTGVHALQEGGIGSQAIVPETKLRCIARNVEGTFTKNDTSFDEKSFTKTWVDGFNIFLTTSEARKPKELKLVLTALERSLNRSPSKSTKEDLRTHVSSSIWQAICAHSHGAAVKPAFQALRHFLSRSVIRPQDILLAILREENVDAHERAETSKPSSRATSLESLSAPQGRQYARAFLCKTLSWLRYPDTAPIVGRIVPIFSCSLRGWLESWPEPVAISHASNGNEPIWMSAFKVFLKSHPDCLDLLANHVFPELVRYDRAGIEEYAQVLENPASSVMTSYSPVDLQVHLLLLRSIVEHASSTIVDSRAAESTGADLLCHARPQTRSAAFSLIVHSSASKQPLAEKTLDSLHHALPFFHTEVDPKLRQDNLAMIKKLILRLTATLKTFTTMSTLSVAKASSTSVVTIEPIQESRGHKQHEVFFAWYFEFLVHELGPTASYQRHVVALKVLEFLFSSLLTLREPWGGRNFYGHKRSDSPLMFDIDAELVTSLLDLIIDPFDDVRESAATVLSNILQTTSMNRGLPVDNKTSNGHPLFFAGPKSGRMTVPLALGNPIWTDTLYRIEAKMQSTGRADHADGFGRLYDLFHGPDVKFNESSPFANNPQATLGEIASDLEHAVALAGTDIHLAVRTATLHGYLITTRYLFVRAQCCTHTYPPDSEGLRLWRNIINWFLDLSIQVWEAVKTILTADAPEGYELEGHDESEIGNKELLSYCWRALKESSTLMHSTICSSKPTIISQAFQKDHYRKLGQLAFEQLAELRHRGAFSAVSRTFAECCLRCAQSGESETQALPKHWYQETLLCIQQRGSALTRRSAGLPAMITGILTAYPEGVFFDRVLRDLQSIADSTTIPDGSGKRVQLPQVHAFNCLKDIFTETKFASWVEQHVSDSLEIAVRALESNQWAIRNCGLMLLKALITRLNDGTNTASSRVSSSHRRLSSFVYDKYQNLPDLLLRLLEYQDTATSQIPQPEAKLAETLALQAQRVFPALEIIEQSGIPKRHQNEIRQAVWRHLEGPVWPIREKAAKALSHLPLGDNIEREMKECLPRPWTTQNALHGRHLYLKLLLARIEPGAKELFESVFACILEHFPIMISRNCCSLTRSSYIGLLAEILEAETGGGQHQGRSFVDVGRYHYPFSEEPRKEGQSPRPWQAFVSYLHQPCPAGPCSASEEAAKLRCRRLVDRRDGKHREEYPLPVDDKQSIFRNPGSYTIAEEPDHSDHVLRQTGSYVASQVEAAEQRMSSTTETIKSWVRALTLAQDEEADVSTRQAAVDSIVNYFKTMGGSSMPLKSSSEMLRLYLLLYDSLLDDDEDVRESGAATVSKVLFAAVSQDVSTRRPIAFTVPAARHQLLKFLREDYHGSAALWTESWQRIIGCPSIGERTDTTRSTQLPAPKTVLEALRRDDNALFVEEKQNLYIDEAQEAELWQAVLLSLDRMVWNADALQHLHSWAVKGVDALVEAAQWERDGPLGWTSKPDVYVLGVRILLAAEAVQHFCKHKAVDFDNKVLRERLHNLLFIGQKCTLRPAWMRIIRRILGDAVLGGCEDGSPAKE